MRLLFNKQFILPDDIVLRYDKDLLRLDVCLQSEENRCYDLLQRVGKDGLTLSSTRVYDDNARDRWLKYRYHNVARASVKEGVLYEPGS